MNGRRLGIAGVVLVIVGVVLVGVSAVLASNPSVGGPGWLGGMMGGSGHGPAMMGGRTPVER